MPAVVGLGQCETRQVSSPVLKQFGDLSPRDFADHRVWVACHVEEYDEPWYEGTDEETFGPWNGRLPVERSDDMWA